MHVHGCQVFGNCEVNFNNLKSDRYAAVLVSSALFEIIINADALLGDRYAILVFINPLATSMSNNVFAKLIG